VGFHLEYCSSWKIVVCFIYTPLCHFPFFFSRIWT